MNLFSCQRKLLSKKKERKKKKKLRKRTSDVGKSRNHHLYKLKAEREIPLHLIPLQSLSTNPKA
ncbi:unnamed protein product [Brassica rapa subsp. narinosa]